MPKARKRGQRATVAHTVRYVHSLRVARYGVHRFDRAASDHATSDLLGLVMEGSVSAGALDELAGGIDTGEFASAVQRPDELWSIADVSAIAAARLMAAFELARRAAAPEPPAVVRGPSDVAAMACRQLGGLRRERVIVIVCDAANRPLRTVVVSDGAVDRSLMPVRELLHAVLRWDGRAFAVAHNHPSGDTEPSDADIAATREIAHAAGAVGLRFLGHVVVGPTDWSTITW